MELSDTAPAAFLTRTNTEEFSATSTISAAAARAGAGVSAFDGAATAPSSIALTPAPSSLPPDHQSAPSSAQSVSTSAPTPVRTIVPVSVPVPVTSSEVQVQVMSTPALSGGGGSGPAAASGGLSLMMSALREAAQEVVLEESIDGKDALLAAADQIARERGLSSPLRSSRNLDDSLTFSQNFDLSNADTAKLHLLQQQHQQQQQHQNDPLGSSMASVKVEEDVSALFKEMNIEPASVACSGKGALSVDAGLDADVTALMSMRGEINEQNPVLIAKRAESPSTMGGGRGTKEDKKLKKSYIRDRYLKRVKQLDENDQNKRNLRGSKQYGLVAEQSVISRILVEDEGQPWTEKMRGSFKSSTQELLLLNMKQFSTARELAQAKARRTSTPSRRPSGRERDLERERDGERERKGGREDADVERERKGCSSSCSSPGGLSNGSSRHSRQQQSSSRLGRQQVSEAWAVLANQKRNEAEKYKQMRSSTERLASTGTMGRSSAKLPKRRGNGIISAANAELSLAYGTFDDVKECTFRPNLSKTRKKQPKADDDDDRIVEDAKYGFISRQEAQARTRREDLIYKQAKEDYDARVDKKVCPDCGMPQSYDELKEKRKQCPNCRKEYQPKLLWNKVSRKFFQNEALHVQRVAEKKLKIEKTVEEELLTVERSAIDRETGRLVMVKDKVDKNRKLTKEEEEEFFFRLEQKLAKREKNLQMVTSKVLSEQCPFKPTLPPRRRRKHRGEGEGEDDESYNSEMDSDYDPFEAFLDRYADDMERRMEEYPEKFPPRARERQSRGAEARNERENRETAGRGMGKQKSNAYW